MIFSVRRLMLDCWINLGWSMIIVFYYMALIYWPRIRIFFTLAFKMLARSI